ncbi:hypothetical protein BDN67DRAFT_973940 [Paxillus ammoniavirescens]|nr:hypothetical protein BDN67DRAFT_973940 [Paxillus ammoniavirescens]
MSTNSSSLDISNVIASELLNLNYGTVSVLVIWIYEYAITFDDEVTFLSDSKWNIVKIIYLVCRYLMFPFVITNIFHFLQFGLSLEACKSYFSFNLFAGTTIIICAELMFLMRTYAIWNRSKAALIIIVVNFTAFLVPIVVILVFFNSAVTVMPSSGITSCDDVSQSHVIVWAYIILVVGETEILLSTVYQSVRHYRQVGGKSRLLSILVRHNSFYFCCSLASSVTVIATTAFLPDTYGDLLANLQTIMHGILVTRMHRSLWNSDREKKNPSHPTDVSLPTMLGTLPSME